MHIISPKGCEKKPEDEQPKKKQNQGGRRQRFQIAGVVVFFFFGTQNFPPRPLPAPFWADSGSGVGKTMPAFALRGHRTRALKLETNQKTKHVGALSWMEGKTFPGDMRHNLSSKPAAKKVAGGFPPLPHKGAVVNLKHRGGKLANHCKSPCGSYLGGPSGSHCS